MDTIDLSVFKNEGDADDIQQDRVGYEPKETDVYSAAIKMAYVDQSARGAYFVHLELEFKDNSTMRYDLYYTNKNGDTRWSKNGRSGNMPGFNKLRGLVAVTLGLDKEFAELLPQTKKVEVLEKGKVVLDDKAVLVELIGKKVLVGITKELTNPGVKNDKGGYDPGPGTRESNEIERFYQAPKGFTVKELTEGADTPEFVTKWLKKNKGKAIDKRTIKDASDVQAAAGNAAPTTPIFS